jgi:hypothetical protein
MAFLGSKDALGIVFMAGVAGDGGVASDAVFMLWGSGGWMECCYGVAMAGCRESSPAGRH